MKDFNFYLLVSSLVVCGFLAGFIFSNIQSDATHVRVQGLWLPELKAVENYKGTFICINVDKTESIKDLVETCEHEVGHEVFARVCAKNFTKCEELE